MTENSEAIVSAEMTLGTARWWLEEAALQRELLMDAFTTTQQFDQRTGRLSDSAKRMMENMRMLWLVEAALEVAIYKARPAAVVDSVVGLVANDRLPPDQPA